MSDLNCPYCNAEIEICHDDGFGYEEDIKHQQECYECEKTFTFTTSISFYYEPEKADCLNDGEHDYEVTRHFPERYRRLRCTMCDHEKPLDTESNAGAAL